MEQRLHAVDLLPAQGAQVVGRCAVHRRGCQVLVRPSRAFSFGYGEAEGLRAGRRQAHDGRGGRSTDSGLQPARPEAGTAGPLCDFVRAGFPA